LVSAFTAAVPANMAPAEVIGRRSLPLISSTTRLRLRLGKVKIFGSGKRSGVLRSRYVGPGYGYNGRTEEWIIPSKQ